MRYHQSAIVIGLFILIMFGMLLAADIIMRREVHQRLIDKIDYLNKIIK